MLHLIVHIIVPHADKLLFTPLGFTRVFFSFFPRSHIVRTQSIGDSLLPWNSEDHEIVKFDLEVVLQLRLFESGNTKSCIREDG